jgi:flagellar motor switch protein FliN/FliY
VRQAQFTDFGPPPVAPRSGMETKLGDTGLGRVLDLRLPVVIELGRTRMLIKDIVELSPGSVIELNKLVGEPVDLFVNGKRFAQGEVVVIDENFGVRITDLVLLDQRLQQAGEA